MASENPYAPGKVPTPIGGSAAIVPPIEEWDPHGDINLPLYPGSELYAPPIVRAPPQLPLPGQHPRLQEFPARGIEAFFTTGLVEMNHQLGFTAHAVQVDNYSTSWLWLPSTRRWVPPAVFGVVCLILPGTMMAEVRLQTPTGHAAGTIGTAAGPVVTVWYESVVMPSTGMPIGV